MNFDLPHVLHCTLAAGLDPPQSLGALWRGTRQTLVWEETYRTQCTDGTS